MKTKQNKAIFLTKHDEQKVNGLYFKYKKKVYTIALSFVKDTYLAEDLTHEILVKCYFSREKFNGDCSFQTWMYRIARNHCIDFLRKSNRNRDLSHEDIDFLNNEQVCTTESEVLHTCDQEELRGKVRQLPSKYQEVITLFYFKDQSLNEIKHHLNIKLSTVKTRLFRARRMLRAMY